MFSGVMILAAAARGVSFDSVMYTIGSVTFVLWPAYLAYSMASYGDF
jgi:hypothetical protein